MRLVGIGHHVFLCVCQRYRVQVLFTDWSRLEWVVDDGIARVVSRFDSWACCGQTRRKAKSDGVGEEQP